MTIADMAVRHPPLTALFALLIAISGITAFTSIPRSVDPHFPIPEVVISVTQPGADAAEVEQAVVRPLEDVVRGLENVKSVHSYSTNGVGLIAITFDWSGDAEAYYGSVVREVNAVRSRLPEGITRMEFRRVRTTESKLLQYALVSETASFRRLQKTAQDLADELETDPGVREINVWGLKLPRVQVSLDMGRLAQLKMPATTVVQGIESTGSIVPSGEVQSGTRSFNVKGGGAFHSLDEVRDIALRSVEGSVVRIDDVADVEWADPPRTHITRANGQRAIFITVEQKDGADAIQLRNRLETTILSFRKRLPPDTALETVFDQASDIERVMTMLVRDFAIALGLVVVALLPLGLRASLIVTISIPLSLGVGILGLYVLGFTLNQLAVAGFILALGLVVDDSIVVVENITRKLRDGASPIGAAVAGTSQIASAVIGTTAVLIFAFLPLVFLPEGAGRFIQSLPAAVIFSIGGSMIVALTTVPLIASRVLPSGGAASGNRFLKAFDLASRKVFRPALRHALNAPRLTLAATGAACLAAIGLVPLLGFSLFPAADTPYFTVEIEATEGAAIEEMDRIVRHAGELIAQEPMVTGWFENVGAGNPQIFYNRPRHEEQANFGQILITIDSWNEQSGPALVERIRQRLNTIPDAEFRIAPFKNGPNIPAEIEISVAGSDLVILKRLAGQVEAILRDTPGTENITNRTVAEQVQLDLGLDLAQAALIDVAPGAPQEAVRLALEGVTAATLLDNDGDIYPVVVSLPGAQQRNIAELEKVYVPTRAGAAVPLLQFARPHLSSGPAIIERYGSRRIATVTADVAQGALPLMVTDAALKRIEAINLPPSYSVIVGGEAEAGTENFEGLVLVGEASLCIIIFILLLEFRSIKLVAISLAVIPLGAFGGLLVLYLTDNSLSFMAAIGFVVLTGIEIKNSVLLVDLAEQLRESGMELREAVEEAGEIRFFPVFLTSVTAIGGLLPLAIGGAALYSPLAWVIIGGLVSSTMLSRVVTPSLYLLVESR